MRRITSLTPLLWVLPEDVFRMSGPPEMQSRVSTEFKCQSWFLDDGRALAVSFRELLTDRGVPLDLKLFYELTRPLFKFFRPYLVEDCDALDLVVPATRFWPRVILQPAEGDKRYAMYMLSKLDGFEPFGFRAFSTRPLSDAATAKTKEFLVLWCQRSAAQPVNGEILDFGELQCKRYQEPQSQKSYGRDGFEITFNSYQPVTWPWLNLYLSVRRTFLKRERLSFEFFNPTGKEIRHLYTDQRKNTIL